MDQFTINSFVGDVDDETLATIMEQLATMTPQEIEKLFPSEVAGFVPDEEVQWESDFLTRQPNAYGQMEERPTGGDFLSDYEAVMRSLYNTPSGTPRR